MLIKYDVLHTSDWRMLQTYTSLCVYSSTFLIPLLPIYLDIWTQSLSFWRVYTIKLHFIVTLRTVRNVSCRQAYTSYVKQPQFDDENTQLCHTVGLTEISWQLIQIWYVINTSSEFKFIPCTLQIWWKCYNRVF